jgi:hypothetical protein
MGLTQRREGVATLVAYAAERKWYTLGGCMCTFSFVPLDVFVRS